jgi:hypothetical protein
MLILCKLQKQLLFVSNVIFASLQKKTEIISNRELTGSLFCRREQNSSKSLRVVVFSVFQFFFQNLIIPFYTMTHYFSEKRSF